MKRRKGSRIFLMDGEFLHTIPYSHKGVLLTPPKWSLLGVNAYSVAHPILTGSPA
jgi:hypothetical protein